MPAWPSSSVYTPVPFDCVQSVVGSGQRSLMALSVSPTTPSSGCGIAAAAVKSAATTVEHRSARASSSSFPPQCPASQSKWRAARFARCDALALTEIREVVLRGRWHVPAPCRAHVSPAATPASDSADQPCIIDTDVNADPPTQHQCRPWRRRRCAHPRRRPRVLRRRRERARAAARRRPARARPRRATAPGKIDDGRVSRRHALVAWQSGRFIVTDLGSQNGTFADGAAGCRACADAVRTRAARRRLAAGAVRRRPPVRARRACAPSTASCAARRCRRCLAEVERAARGGVILHVRGESGTGKEGVARAFHRAGARASGPLVAVNCAAIPHAIAERLLFGAKRGAYSGADADAAGYLQEADGGTLFLDEIAELDAQVQAKLLRVLESKEILPLGASKPRKVDFGFVLGDQQGSARARRRRHAARGSVLPHRQPGGDAAAAAQPARGDRGARRRRAGRGRRRAGGARVARRAVPAAAVAGQRARAARRGARGGAGRARRRQPRDGAPPGADGGQRCSRRGTRRAHDAAPPTRRAGEWPRKRMPQVDDEWRRRIEDALRDERRQHRRHARARSGCTARSCAG